MGATSSNGGFASFSLTFSSLRMKDKCSRIPYLSLDYGLSLDWLSLDWLSLDWLSLDWFEPLLWFPFLQAQ